MTEELVAGDKRRLALGRWLILAALSGIAFLLGLIEAGVIPGSALVGTSGSRFFAVLLLLLGILSALTIGFLIYFIPWIVAVRRGHHLVASVAVLNILLGWTLIGWAVALAVAVGPVRKVKQ